jgi:hypothetical protein
MYKHLFLATAKAKTIAAEAAAEAKCRLYLQEVVLESRRHDDSWPFFAWQCRHGFSVGRRLPFRDWYFIRSVGTMKTNRKMIWIFGELPFIVVDNHLPEPD